VKSHWCANRTGSLLKNSARTKQIFACCRGLVLDGISRKVARAKREITKIVWSIFAASLVVPRPSGRSILFPPRDAARQWDARLVKAAITDEGAFHSSNASLPATTINVIARAKRKALSGTLIAK
jgi:hypothetical protein